LLRLGVSGQELVRRLEGPRHDAGAAQAIDPRDAEAWQAMLTRFGADAPHIFGLLGNVMPSWAVARVIWKAWRQNGTAWTHGHAALPHHAGQDMGGSAFP
jgi:hypothetical protein